MSTAQTKTDSTDTQGDGARVAGASPWRQATAGLVAETPRRRRREARRRSYRRSSDRSAATEALLAEETQRIAAEVHDLVMQDLCLALANARTLEDDPAVAARASVVAAAAERALVGAREILSGLSCQDRKPVAETVEASVRTAARDTQLRFDAWGLSPDAQPDQPTLGALVHVAREAVTNAVKHGDPRTIAVMLEYGDGWRLKIDDDGRGFDVAGRRPGFGLDSMSRHVEALDGLLRLRSAAGAGTSVEVVLP